MACLGGRAELSLLQAATGEPADVVDQALAPALDEGLLVAEPGAHPAVRFRHDRIREAVLGRLDPRAAARPAAGHGAAAGGGAGVVRGRGRAVPAGGRRGRRRRGAAPGGGAAAARRRPGHADRGLRAGERAADRRASGGRPGRDRHARRGAHRPPRRAVLPGAAGGGGRGVPHDRAAVPGRGGPRGRDGGAGAQPDPPEPFRGGAPARPGVAA